ncbi:MarR family transcriptional regulator [Gemmatimonas aurantiaca T-27]|uniref:MarR family transcriptional regulator n=1 Tax=Gemmatimonas aurantiaca (strain DSM 14586 / JCM 11422 / NBRC 100505 / T-27) TaxID=379066 RepID=C1A682_GEMAT|nr:MarR family winged helix-turn-helix transcriptional regulator [Gemmatimonas aurantiaca]BAH37742.1 MarR family transcriptional regulator [Gemmatimonas aurantiaca T-27]
MPRSTPTPRSTNPDADPAPDPLVQQVGAGLFKLGLALRTHAWRENGPRGLTPTQAQVLALLHASAVPLRLSAVADGLAVTLPTASDAVKALVAKGFVEKTRADDDGRAIALTLTALGQDEARRGESGPEFVAAVVDALTPDEQAAFLRSLTKMVHTLQERGDIAPARMCVSCQFFRPWAHPEDGERPHHCAFVDAPFGDRALRLDCPDYLQEIDDVAEARFRRFEKTPSDGDLTAPRCAGAP